MTARKPEESAPPGLAATRKAAWRIGWSIVGMVLLSALLWGMIYFAFVGAARLLGD
ncbi:MAG: hypothetical protein AB7O04_10145 [Hyphomonadaceae bacterium]